MLVGSSPSLSQDCGRMSPKYHHALPSTHLLLEQLSIISRSSYTSFLSCALFNGNLSSVRKLEFGGVVTGLSWKNLPNLLNRIPEGDISTTTPPRLLRVRSSAWQGIVILLDAGFLQRSPERLVSPPRLQEFILSGPPLFPTFGPAKVGSYTLRLGVPSALRPTPHGKPLHPH